MPFMFFVAGHPSYCETRDLTVIGDTAITYMCVPTTVDPDIEGSYEVYQNVIAYEDYRVACVDDQECDPLPPIPLQQRFTANIWDASIAVSKEFDIKIQ